MFHLHLLQVHSRNEDLKTVRKLCNGVNKQLPFMRLCSFCESLPATLNDHFAFDRLLIGHCYVLTLNMYILMYDVCSTVYVLCSVVAEKRYEGLLNCQTPERIQV